MFHIEEIAKDAVVLMQLVAELDAYQSGLYPAESNHCLDLQSIDDASLRCIIVWDAQGNAAGCGAVLLNPASNGEIKRVYIRPTYRGQRLGEQIVAYLETLARHLACSVLRLETGIYQDAAIVLYTRCGYRRCAAFPPYQDDPLSVFMEKDIQKAEEAIQ